MENGQTPKAAVYQIKGWHLYLVVATLLVTMGTAYGTAKAQLDQNTKDIQDMRSEKYVPKEDYWRDMGELKDQIGRLEGKIDALSRLMK